MASHHLQEVEQICDRIYLLAEGQCRATGTLEELLDTGDRRLVVRGLDEAATPSRSQAAIAHAGGEVSSRSGHERQQTVRTVPISDRPLVYRRPMVADRHAHRPGRPAPGWAAR